MSAAPSADNRKDMRQYMQQWRASHHVWRVADIDPIALGLINAYIKQEKQRTGQEPKIGPLISPPLIKHFAAQLPQAVVEEVLGELQGKD